jgi:hypothetical protein
MRYNFIISFDSGFYQLWNKTSDNEWEITFEHEQQMLNFMKMLLEKR